MVRRNKAISSRDQNDGNLALAIKPIMQIEFGVCSETSLQAQTGVHPTGVNSAWGRGGGGGGGGGGP